MPYRSLKYFITMQGRHSASHTACSCREGRMLVHLHRLEPSSVAESVGCSHAAQSVAIHVLRAELSPRPRAPEELRALQARFAPSATHTRTPAHKRQHKHVSTRRDPRTTHARRTHARTHTHTHTHTHTRRHTHTHSTRAHAHTQTHTHTHTHTLTHSHTHTLTHTHRSRGRSHSVRVGEAA